MDIAVAVVVVVDGVAAGCSVEATKHGLVVQYIVAIVADGRPD